MSEPSYPVTVAVQRRDGTIEHVRVGTAVRSGDGFQLTLGQLAIGATPETAAARRPAPAGDSARRAAPAGDGGMVFPPYGRSKGEPIAGASIQDLEFYAGGCRRTLGDASKSRWHDKERQLLTAIEAELARQGGAPGGGGAARYGRDEPPPFGDDDVPPPRGDDDVPY